MRRREQYASEADPSNASAATTAEVGPRTTVGVKGTIKVRPAAVDVSNGELPQFKPLKDAQVFFDNRLGGQSSEKRRTGIIDRNDLGWWTFFGEVGDAIVIRVFGHVIKSVAVEINKYGVGGERRHRRG
jgi:hypothetical protein